MWRTQSRSCYIELGGDDIILALAHIVHCHCALALVLHPANTDTIAVTQQHDRSVYNIQIKGSNNKTNTQKQKEAELCL
jgi:hypothetical protein